jgi:hypothetical protein
LIGALEQARLDPALKPRVRMDDVPVLRHAPPFV